MWSIGRFLGGEYNESLGCDVGGDAGGGGAGDVADADGDSVCCVCDIRLSKKYRKGLRRLVNAAIAKSLGVYWRSCKKANDDKYKLLLLLLSLNKQDRRS